MSCFVLRISALDFFLIQFVLFTLTLKHVERKEDDDWVKSCTRMEVEANRPRGRPRKTWMKTLEDDMRRCVLSPVDAKDKFMKREDPWCETADLGKPGYTMGVFTNGSTVKPTSLFYSICILVVMYC
jgi:hypothetical protein